MLIKHFSSFITYQHASRRDSEFSVADPEIIKETWNNMKCLGVLFFALGSILGGGGGGDERGIVRLLLSMLLITA